MKRGRLFIGCTITIFSLFLLSCLPSFDAQNLILNDPRVKAFLEDNPNADITIVHFSTEESLTELPKYAEVCGKTLTSGKELYKAELVDPTKGLKIITYLDADTKVIDCVRRFGAEGRPAEISEPPAAPTTTPPTPTTPACGNSIKEGTEECDDGNAIDIDGCTTSCLLCLDTDGGKDFTVKGQTFHKGSGTAIDQCTGSLNNQNIAVEYFCKEDKTLGIANQVCTYGCSEGVCLPAPTTATPACGNGKIEGTCNVAGYSEWKSCKDEAINAWNGEVCDDGNTQTGDGCSSTCQFECTDSDGGENANSKGTVRGVTFIDKNSPGNYETRTDSCYSYEPNKVIEFFCRSDGLWSNRILPCEYGCHDGVCLSAPAAVCGNGIKEGSETCDDSNTANGDGCSSACQTERRLVY